MTYTQPLCPECTQGKCDNCTIETIDADDTFTLCRHEREGHGPR